MPDQILIFYGSYRSDRMGIRLANFVVSTLRSRGADAELIDAKAVSLPMLDRMYKEFAPGTAPPAMEALATKIKAADAFVFVTGEYNWGMQPGLKNLTDHFLEEWFWRPAAIVSYSAGRFAGARANTAWHGTLSEMGMVVVSSTLAVGRSRMPWTPTVSRSVHSVKHYNKRSRDSLMISRGGLKRRRLSVPASYRHTDGLPKSALGQKLKSPYCETRSRFPLGA